MRSRYATVCSSFHSPTLLVRPLRNTLDVLSFKIHYTFKTEGLKSTAWLVVTSLFIFPVLTILEVTSSSYHARTERLTVCGRLLLHSASSKEATSDKRTDSHNDVCCACSIGDKKKQEGEKPVILKEGEVAVLQGIVSHRRKEQVTYEHSSSPTKMHLN
eukprot:768624-Hanusia_phi.AAC.12